MSYKSKYNQKAFNYSGKISNPKNITSTSISKSIEKKLWREHPYNKQNWGIWLHHMSQYVGKMKPAMAHFLINSSTKKNERVFDPFCGVGTVPLEAELLERFGYGCELNPYAYNISMAKFSVSNHKKLESYLDSVNIETKGISIQKFSKFCKKFYHPKTLREISFLMDKLKKDKQHFLIGCLLGIIHGHRPGHLSAVTSLVIPYLPKEKPVYKEVIPRLKAKCDRMFFNDFPNKFKGTIFYDNAKKLKLKENFIDAIISSPPYYSTLDYIADNRLRLEMLGYDESSRKQIKNSLTTTYSTYIKEMREIGINIRRFLKLKKFCIFVLGDHHSGKKIINTAEEIGNIYSEIGFKIKNIIEDKMPTNKAIPTNVKRKKSDRILIMQKVK